MSSKAVQGCVALRVLGRRETSTATIHFPFSNMVFPTIKLRWLLIGWRLAYQDPTPAWKKKGVVHFQSGLVDLALFAAVVGLALLSMFS